MKSYLNKPYNINSIHYMQNYFKEQDVLELIISLFTGVKFKSLLSVGFVALTFGFDSLHIQALIALMILIWADSFTAIYAAYCTNQTITSSKFFRTFIKIAIYYGLIYMMHITEYGFPEAVRYLDDMMIAFAVATEMLSILENVEKLGYPVPSKIIRALINIRDGNK